MAFLGMATIELEQCKVKTLVHQMHVIIIISIAVREHKNASSS